MRVLLLGMVCLAWLGCSSPRRSSTHGTEVPCTDDGRNAKAMKIIEGRKPRAAKSLNVKQEYADSAVVYLYSWNRDGWRRPYGGGRLTLRVSDCAVLEHELFQ